MRRLRSTPIHPFTSVRHFPLAIDLNVSIQVPTRDDNVQWPGRVRHLVVRIKIDLTKSFFAFKLDEMIADHVMVGDMPFERRDCEVDKHFWRAIDKAVLAIGVLAKNGVQRGSV